ncbi:MAG: hypothetical protein QOK05_3062 [Chloroflexota bacterium]|nr:hypothetical protein [Chloroflexota bacterium]
MASVDTIRHAREAEDIDAAVAQLREGEPEELRAALLERYAALADDGARGDRGARLRTSLMLGLRGVARSVDAEVAEQGTYVYERSATSKWDVAGNLRGAALLLLSELDPQLALFHAARLLVDPETPEMSGEPAVTAVRVLRAHDQLLPIYMFLGAARPGLGEVVGECLSAMVGAPGHIVRDLVDRYRDDDDDAVRAGLYDMLLARPDDPRAREAVEAFIREGRPDPVYAYVATSIVAARTMPLVELIREVAGTSSGLRERMLREALGFLPA